MDIDVYKRQDDHFPAGPEVTIFDFKSRLYVDVILQDSLFLKLADGFTPEFGCPGGLDVYKRQLLFCW